MNQTVMLSVALGLFAGWYWGNEVRRRKNAEAKVNELEKRLESASFATSPEKQLKKVFFTVVDIHKQIRAVTKALVKPAQ